MEQIIYNWYETNIAQFLMKYNLPVKHETDNICDFIEQYSEQYLKDFDQILLDGPFPNYDAELYDLIGQQKPFIKDLFEKIKLSVFYWQNAQQAQAESIINKIFSNVKNDFYITGINALGGSNPQLFRVRAKIDKPTDQIDKKDLFHIPFAQRSKVSNERFSIAGQPCLYLSTSKNIAWKECGFPSKFYFSKFVFDYQKDESDPWHFLTFIKPTEICQLFLIGDKLEKEFYRDLLCRYIRTFPVIFASSIVSNKNDQFKPEYVFPQMIMQWIFRNFDQIKGITYFSCLDDDNPRQYLGYNIAIPAVKCNKLGYSEPILSRFDNTPPQIENNAFSKESQRKIVRLYEKIKSYQLYQNELCDCVERMQKLLRRVVILIDNSEKIESTFLLTSLDSIIDNFYSFEKEFHCKTILENCRRSNLYQNRYEYSLSVFIELFGEFIEIKGILEKYFLKTEHGDYLS